MHYVYQKDMTFRSRSIRTLKEGEKSFAVKATGIILSQEGNLYLNERNTLYPLGTSQTIPLQRVDEEYILGNHTLGPFISFNTGCKLNRYSNWVLENVVGLAPVAPYHPLRFQEAIRREASHAAEREDFIGAERFWDLGKRITS